MVALGVHTLALVSDRRQQHTARAAAQAAIQVLSSIVAGVGQQLVDAAADHPASNQQQRPQQLSTVEANQPSAGFGSFFKRSFRSSSKDVSGSGAAPPADDERQTTISADDGDEHLLSQLRMREDADLRHHHETLQAAARARARRFGASSSVPGLRHATLARMAQQAPGGAAEGAARRLADADPEPWLLGDFD